MSDSVAAQGQAGAGRCSLAYDTEPGVAKPAHSARMRGMPGSRAIAVLESWIAAVNAGDLDTVLRLYADEHVLLATFSPHMIRSDADTRRYFEQLASRPGLSVRLHPRTLTELPLGTAFSVLIGIYTFSFEVDGDPISFASRFTFVIDTGSEQPIVHHHSSQIPRTLS